MKLINKFKVSLIMSGFLILMLGIKCLASNGIVTEASVNIRKEASTDSEKIVTISKNDKVNILEKSEQWYKVEYKNKIGYVYSKYIKVEDENNLNSDENSDITEEIEKKFEIQKEAKIRIIPNISSTVIYTFKENTDIEVLDQMNEWTYISIKNIVGWVRTDLISEVGANASQDNIKDEQKEEDKLENLKTAYIKYKEVNLREKASATSEVLKKLKLNDEIKIIKDVDTVWYKIKVGDTTGYISKELVSFSKQNESTTSRSGADTKREEEIKDIEKNTTSQKTDTNESKNSEKKDKDSEHTKITGEQIVEYAKKYLGYKYVYGGSSPKTGFDCSGFTSYVYKNFGYSLSRSSTGQANNGTKVSKENLQPGDILIFKNQLLTKIGHVGIYIGNNKMIHASEPGVGVVITEIDSKSHKYPQRFVMGRRIIK